MSLIKCENVSVAYSSEPVIKNISFSIEKGMYLCLFGENGSGKTTLMKAILNLVPVETGKIIKQKNLQIGYLPQQTAIQKDFPISVFEVVLSGFIKKKGLFPFYSKDMKNSALKNLEKVGIAELKNSSYRELSGGQQQRVLLARALCSSEDIIFLDEPVTALDPIASAELYEIIKKLNKNGMTVVMVSHDISYAVKDASHVLHIANHEAEFFGSTEDYLKTETGKRFAKC